MVFLHKARGEGFLQPSTRLCATVLQQVQQSGLLQHLADMMANATEELARVTAAAARVQTPDSTPTGIEPAAAAGSSSSTPSSSSRGDNTHSGVSSVITSVRPATPLEHSAHLLGVLANVCRMIPSGHEQFRQVPAAVYPAALRLVNTGLQHVSAVLPQVQQQQQQQQQQGTTEQPAVQGASPENSAWLATVESFFTGLFGT